MPSPRIALLGPLAQRLQLFCSSCRKQWADPCVFQPEQFLTANGTAINKTSSEKVMLFGMGKCRCIGEVLAKGVVFLFLAILLQQLEFSVPPGMKVDLTPIYGLTVKHTHREHVQAWLCFTIKWRRHQHAEGEERMEVSRGPQSFFSFLLFLNNSFIEI